MMKTGNFPCSQQGILLAENREFCLTKNAWLFPSQKDLSQDPSRIAAVVSREGTEFVQYAALFLLGGLLVPLGHLLGDPLPGHEVQPQLSHPPVNISSEGIFGALLRVDFHFEATNPFRVEKL